MQVYILEIFTYIFTSYLNIFMREFALLARYVDTYEEFVIVSETTHCNGMTFII